VHVHGDRVVAVDRLNHVTILGNCWLRVLSNVRPSSRIRADQLCTNTTQPTMSSSHKSKKHTTIPVPTAPPQISQSIVSSDDDDEDSEAGHSAGPSRRVRDVDSSEIDEDEEDEEVNDLTRNVERGTGGKGKRKEYS
jgi:hypothetical protein